MAEDTQMIGKLEPIVPGDDEEVDMKTLGLYSPDEHIQVLDDEHLNNTDGNLHINTYQVVEEVVDEGEFQEDESDSSQHVLIRAEDGTYIQEDGEMYVEEGTQFEEEEYEEEAQYTEQQYEIRTEGTKREQDVDEEEDYVEQSPLALDPDDPDPDPDFDADYRIEEFMCVICMRAFKSPASLKRHITVAHGQEAHKNEDPLAFELCACCGEPCDSAHLNGSINCEQCDKLFVLQSNLVRHLSLEHPVSDNVYKCCDCSRTFDSRDGIHKHMQSHPLAKPFSCKACNRDFTRKYHLDRHVQQTGCDGTPRNQFKCQVCHKSFSRKDNLRDHLRAHAGQIKKKKVFTCSYCKKDFQGAALLAVHVRTHTGEKPFACDLCPKWFPSSGAMKKHRRMHTGERPYQCMQCKKRFAAKETLNRHTRTHTGNKPHQCTYCGKAFIQATQLRAHIFHHTGEHAFTCPHCNKAFNRRVRLTTHIKFVHEGAKPMQCSQCDKKFYRKEDQSRHELLHTGQKPYECEICQKRFAVKASLKIHANIHRKEQPCSCYECGRAFIRQDCLLRHMRAKHRDALEDIMVSAEKRRLQEQLLTAASDAANTTKKDIVDSGIWNELTLTDSIRELLGLLVDENTLTSFGWPDSPVDKILDCVIRRCGHDPASAEDFDYINRIRENAKLLFTVVIDDEAVKSLLNNQTVDEVIQHVLRLAKNE